MPIAVHAVTEAEFNTWIEQAKKAASGDAAHSNLLAAAEPAGSKDVQR
jgi:heme/copper-type cytochrome/quinol oxidase subunit 2